MLPLAKALLRLREPGRTDYKLATKGTKGCCSFKGHGVVVPGHVGANVWLVWFDVMSVFTPYFHIFGGVLHGVYVHGIGPTRMKESHHACQGYV